MNVRTSVAVEWTLRSFAIATYLLLLLAIFNNWRVTEHPYSLTMLLVTETFTLLIIVCARRATQRDLSPVSVIAVVYTSSYFLLLEPAGSKMLIPDWAGAVVQTAGLALTLLGKATLGRAFGILPAVRGLVTSGPYRLVRHPIYLGYMISNVGFLLANASVRNAVVLGVLVVVQVVRIYREEAAFELSDRADAFKEYRSRVRFRLLPPLF